MAELTKPTAATAAKSSTSVQPKKKGNSISWVAPLVCVISGYLIWRFIIGADGNFTILMLPVVFIQPART